VEELHRLVQRGYRQLYRRRLDWPRQALGFLAFGFPAALRRHAWAFWLSAALFFGPMLAMGLACHQDATLIHSLLDSGEVSSLESMYDPTNRTPGREAARQSDTDFAMFGFYVMNNVGIAFRTFAGGLIAGVGSLFFLGFNGLVIGAAAGHLTAIGHGTPFWTFVSGHAALELTAIAVSGAAGLLLAAALLAPGRRRRLDALRANALEAVTLVTGAMVMLVLAAMVEAFWSSATTVSGEAKVLLGAVGWLLVALYFMRAGRGRADAAR
jgi:uncharacterized membrane protein SpoIIM required for sporulation